MKVVLATSPHVRHPAVLQGDFKPNNAVMYSFAPVGLLSLAAMLRRERPEVDCEIYDINRKIISGALPLGPDFYAATAEDICSHAPDVIGFMTECDSYHHLLQVAVAIKAIAPECSVVLGGPHASVVARTTLERCAAVDAVVVGEGEITFLHLLDELKSKRSGRVAGAMLRGGALGIVDGGNRGLIEDLDDLPIPAYGMYRADPDEEIFLEVGRGCPFKCAFCSTAPYWKRRHRVKSPQRVLIEIRTVQQLYGTRRVHFTHDLFTTNRAWVEAVCSALIDAGAPIRWTCSARADTVDEPLLALMAIAGCNAVYFGIESGSERILREIQKGIPLAQSFSVMEACLRHGITPNAGFIAGFPTEDETSLRDTFRALEQALRLGCRPTHLFAFCPFAGAPMYAGLRNLTCTGHFLDIPLGRETDLRNRLTVAGDAELYGAYFRPLAAGRACSDEGALFAIDEFSPLVEAALAPTLALASLCGGMYQVFVGWLRWIRKANDARQAEAYRRGYGSAGNFATYVLEALESSPGASRKAIALARAVKVHLSVAEVDMPARPTTMASHRSLTLPDVGASSKLELHTSLARGAIVAALAVEFDVTPALLGEMPLDFDERPTYLIWQAMADRSLRLLQVDRMVFETLESLSDCERTVADVVLDRIRRKDDAGDRGELDPAALVASLSNAAREGLITIGDH